MGQLMGSGSERWSEGATAVVCAASGARRRVAAASVL